MSKHAVNQQPSSEQRICRKCGAHGPLESFRKVYSQTARGKQYWSHTCLICDREAKAKQMRMSRKQKPGVYRAIAKRSYWKHREEKKIWRKAYQQRLRNEVFAAYGGYKCRCCGETMPSMLTLDHVNNDGCEHRKREPWLRWSRTFYKWIIDQKFPKEFQVLCYNCNLSKYRCGGICEHKLREGSTTIPKGSRAKRLEVPNVSTRR